MIQISVFGLFLQVSLIFLCWCFIDYHILLKLLFY